MDTVLVKMNLGGKASLLFRFSRVYSKVFTTKGTQHFSTTTAYFDDKDQIFREGRGLRGKIWNSFVPAIFFLWKEKKI